MKDRVVPRYEVDAQGNCSKCGGVHYGTGRKCVYSDEQLAAMQRDQVDEQHEVRVEGTVS